MLPAWYKALEEQGGCGYMHESEGSVITDIWRNSAANYNTALRKAAEHEPISRNRCKGASEIVCPKLSMLLTGTFSQYRALVPSVENGYFSRLLTMVVRGTHPFDRHYVSATMTQSAIPTAVGNRLLRIYEQLAQAEEQEWSLTDAQKARLGEHLETEYGTLIGLLGENFHSAIIRMAIQIERMALILSALRILSTDRCADRIQTTLICRDEDYETAEVIGNKLLLHMAAAYQMIEGDMQELVPEVKPLDQRKVLLSALPEEFESKKLVEEATSRGIARRTVLRWNEKWQQEGVVQQIRYGAYRKVV
jgi:ABC-type multidrug transport system fused ATPase/permease subunit